VEIPIALVALILSAPIMAVLAILVKLDSPGPALFRHYRVGKGGRLFHFTKFRTLYVDAKKRFPHLYAYDYTQEEVDKLCFKIPNDPRVTRLGRWLRQSTLDELPNFWHVLVGDMSLVGPRPEIPEMLSYYTDEELAKFSVRPGITGLAQISGRGRLTFRDTVAYDLDYVRDHSFRSDFHIVMMTVWKILLRDGAF
jgi:lipopolysaccharide/colanic/teichoic acid biosynthesis glycosyltransferase